MWLIKTWRYVQLAVSAPGVVFLAHVWSVERVIVRTAHLITLHSQQAASAIPFVAHRRRPCARHRELGGKAGTSEREVRATEFPVALAESLQLRQGRGVGISESPPNSAQVLVALSAMVHSRALLSLLRGGTVNGCHRVARPAT